MKFDLRFTRCSLWTPVLMLIATSNIRAEDVVEFLNGSKVRGSIKEIRKVDKEFDFEVKVGGRDFVRTYSFAKVHAVTMKGKRYVLTARSHRSSSANPANAVVNRSPAQVRKIIREQGSTPPDWFDSTPHSYPSSLDLSWPEKPNGKWNNQVNVGQYMWDVINPNPNRWRSGLKLLHHLSSLHKDNSKLLNRDMKSIGGFYFRLFQDYARAAFWLQKAGVRKGTGESVMLAECYWRLGSKSLALQTLDSRKLPVGAIKLYGDMGQTREALKWVDVYVRAGRPHEAYLAGADALRVAGRYEQAIKLYQKVLAAKGARNKQYDDRFRARARESIQAIQLFDQADVTKVADGTYRASSTGYNGALDVEVKVASGRVESVAVVRHQEKQFYSALTDTTNQIVKKQSVRGIDATSRATITSQAIVNATAKALAGVKN